MSSIECNEEFNNIMEKITTEEIVEDMIVEDTTVGSSMESLSQQYQLENKYNNLLPYANELDDEARIFLAEIKAQLGRGIMLRRIQPDCCMAIRKLRMYLKLYSCRFTKEDHIILIKLIYEVIITPDLALGIVSLFANTMAALLKKIELISPSELELQWRPLYDLLKQALDRSDEMKLVVGMQRITPMAAKTLNNLIHLAKNYFPVTATQEILDELRPHLCPFDAVTMEKTFVLLELFLPLQLFPQDSIYGYKLWFDEFMKLWEVYHNAPYWEHSIMSLMAGLAYSNIGYINWEPYIPLMFTRFLRSLNLPVVYKKYSSSKVHKIGMQPIAEWIVSVLGSGSSCQLYLEKFLKAIETYFHQANFGAWVEKLKELINKLSSEFLLRLHHERYGKKSWMPSIPDSHKLTDADIDAFVKCMTPVTMAAMYGNSSIMAACKVLRHLATIRPNMVIPCVLERLYLTLDSLTEPHKFTATLMAVTAVARPMAQGRRNVNTAYTYNEGPARIIPLLFAALPGIDANDLRKSSVTFRLIYTYAMVVPIIDCSKSSSSELLDEEERIVCEQTSEFEDFILQFFDRVFSLIESSTLEYVSQENQDNTTGKSKTESLVEYSLGTVCTALLLRMSDDIFRSALHKLRSFVTERVLETRVSGPLAAIICQSFALANGRETVRALLPTISQRILDIMDEVDIAKEERISDRLLYPMLLLSNIVNTHGVHLLPYVDILTEVLDKTLHLESREGCNMASRILANILNLMSSMMATHEYTCNGRDRNDPNYPYVLDWGQGADISDINMHWYVPGEEEISVAQKLFNRYISPEVLKIQEYCKSESSDITRHELLTSLYIISAIIDGCVNLLPLPNSTNDESHIYKFSPSIGIKHEIRMPDGSNVREFLVKIMSELQAVMLKKSEDDTKSLFVVLKIWSTLLLGKCRTVEWHKRHWAAWKQVKSELKDGLIKHKIHLLTSLVDRVKLQHELHIFTRLFNVTDYHREIFFQMFDLATSRYAKVRISAQESIFFALPFLPHSRAIFLPRLLELLAKDPEDDHEAMKGVLYLLLGIRNNPLILGNEWSYLRSLWPALVASKPSEKMSIVHLKNKITDAINRSIDLTSSLAIKGPLLERCEAVAIQLWNNVPKPSANLPTEVEISEGISEAEELVKTNIEDYDGLLHDLLNAIETSTHWRQRVMGMKLLRDLAHCDRSYPVEIVNYFLGALIHESLEERKIATPTIACMLRQQKRPHLKITIDIPDMPKQVDNAAQSIWTSETLKPGLRADNLWLQYNFEKHPVNEEHWDQPRFVHKAYVGYYGWPKQLEVYAPYSKQPSLNMENRIFTDCERVVDIFFADPQNIDKLIQYNSLEERKGKDKFSMQRFLLYKGLFRNYGIRHLKFFIPHLEALVTQKQESSQRCAAEIIAGLIKGSKHWPFSMVMEMQEVLTPIIRQALDNVTTETTHDWEYCFARSLASRDPNRHSWLLECLMEEPKLQGTETSYQECQRLLILRSALSQQPWREFELLGRLLARAEQKLLMNPFQNVRNTLAALLITIFTADYDAGTVKASYSTPCARDLMDRMLPRLLKLTDDSVQVNASEESTLARANDISILKTVSIWLINSALLMSSGITPRFAELLPILCQFENSETDDELRKLCTFALASLSASFTIPRNVNTFLNVLQSISRATSWSTRESCLCFVEVYVFHNMGVILSNSQWVKCIEEIILRLLVDERLEVRERAGQVLCGSLHCAFLPDQDKLLKEFEDKSKIKIRNPDDLRIKHAGVLGLCAFIGAHPYDVPKYVPAIFELLNLRLNDPQPIPSTIRKTLGDFKRTHYDGWVSHAQSFTEEQLAVLQDLIAPPSYYA